MNVHHKQALVILALTAAGDIALGAAFGVTDHIGVGNGLYFATVTATTVGYGDIVPHGWAPHLLSVLMMLTILPLFASVFSFFTTGLTAEHIDVRTTEQTTDIKQHVSEVSGD